MSIRKLFVLGSVFSIQFLINLNEQQNSFQGKSELIGRFDTQPVVDDRTDYEYVPKLQWYDIRRGTEYVGQLLMSVQLLQVCEANCLL